MSANRFFRKINIRWRMIANCHWSFDPKIPDLKAGMYSYEMFAGDKNELWEHKYRYFGVSPDTPCYAQILSSNKQCNLCHLCSQRYLKRSVTLQNKPHLLKICESVLLKWAKLQENVLHCVKMYCIVSKCNELCQNVLNCIKMGQRVPNCTKMY